MKKKLHALNSREAEELAAPVKGFTTAVFVMEDESFGGFYECTQCHGYGIREHFNYCPFCGREIEEIKG